MKYFYNPPYLLKKIFNKSQWNSSVDKILFTFDDGPIPETTELILNELKKNNIKSVFFCVGNNNKKYPSLTSEILSEGHLIGNHTFNHKILTGKNFTKTDLEINSFNELMRDQFNCNIKYFRPPHGKMNLKIQRIIMEKNMKNIMWSLLTYDFRNNFDIVKKSVKKYLKKNSIIVLHDSLKSKDIIVDSINLILDESSKKGFEIGKPEECLK